MAVGCICGVPNTGLDPCPVPSAVPKALIFVKLVSDDGTKNSIPLDTVLDQTAYDALINQADASKRFFPFINGDFFTPTITAPTATTGQFGSNYYGIKKAGETMEFTVPEASKADAALWTSGFGCGQWGVYIVDLNNQIWGYISDDGEELYPARVATGSFIANFNMASASDNLPNRVIITYSIDIGNNDENARVMAGVTADVLNTEGLQTVNFLLSDITATGFTLSASRRSAYASLVPQTGLVQANFALKNKATDVAITITGFVESADGEYDFTHASQASNAQGYLTLTRAGLDGSSLPALTIQYPA